MRSCSAIRDGRYLEDVVAERVEEVVGHDADRVLHAAGGQHLRSYDRSVVPLGCGDQ